MRPIRQSLADAGHAVWAHRATGRQVHDANIVATMPDCGVRRLLTFNVMDFQRFALLIEIDPLP